MIDGRGVRDPSWFAPLTRQGHTVGGCRARSWGREMADLIAVVGILVGYVVLLLLVRALERL